MRARTAFAVAVAIASLVVACGDDESTESDDDDSGAATTASGGGTSSAGGTASTGGGSAMGGGGGGQTAESICNDTCDLAATSGCPQTKAECIMQCIPSYEKCPAETTAVLACEPTFSGCTPLGTPIPTNCNSELAAFAACING